MEERHAKTLHLKTRNYIRINQYLLQLWTLMCTQWDKCLCGCVGGGGVGVGSILLILNPSLATACCWESEPALPGECHHHIPVITYTVINQPWSDRSFTHIKDTWMFTCCSVTIVMISISCCYLISDNSRNTISLIWWGQKPCNSKVLHNGHITPALCAVLTWWRTETLQDKPQHPGWR